MSRENVDVVRGAWEAWGRGDMDAVFDTYDSAIVWDQSHYGTAELSGVYHGHDGVRESSVHGLRLLMATTYSPTSSSTPEMRSWSASGRVAGERRAASKWRCRPGRSTGFAGASRGNRAV